MAMPGSALKGPLAKAAQPGTPFTPHSQPEVSLRHALAGCSLKRVLLNLTQSGICLLCALERLT